MIKTTSMLADELSAYANQKTKIGRMVKNGELTPVVRGLYETDAHAPGYALAGCIYGPSYLSFEYALSRHGIIPEEARTYTSATCGKRRTKLYRTPFGTYEFRDVPRAAFPYEVKLYTEENRSYWMASAEKALCDQMYKLPPVSNAREMRDLLHDDLRVDEAALARLDATVIAQLAEKYRSTNVSALSSHLKRSFV